MIIKNSTISKLIFILLISLLLTTKAQAQLSLSGFSMENFQLFLKSKTKVVLLDSNEQFNAAIKKEMAENWTITPFDFITSKEYEAIKMDPQYSFVMLLKPLIPRKFGSLNREKATLECYMVCVLGGTQLTINQKKQSAIGSFLNTYSVSDEKQCISFVPLDYYGVEHNPEDCWWRMSFIISSLHKAILIAKDQYPKEYDYWLMVKMRDFYQSKMDVIPTKTLWLLRENFYDHVVYEPMEKWFYKPLKEKDLPALYPFKYKIVTRQEITEALETKRDDVCILFRTSQGVNPTTPAGERSMPYDQMTNRTSVFYYDPSTKEIVNYYLIGISPNYFEGNEFEGLGKYFELKSKKLKAK